MGGQEVEELLGGELGRVVALALKERSRKGVFPSKLGKGQVVGVRDDRGDRAIEPEEEVVGPALDRAEDLVEVPAGPPDPNGFDLVKIHGLRARPQVRPRLRPQVHPRNPALALRYLSGPLQLPSLRGIGADAATRDSPFSPRWLPNVSTPARGSPSRLLRRCDRGWPDSVLAESDVGSHVRDRFEPGGGDSRPDHPHADP